MRPRLTINAQVGYETEVGMSVWTRARVRDALARSLFSDGLSPLSRLI